MAGYYEPDFGTANYRSNDPVKNLRIRVTLKRVSAASFIDDKAPSTSAEASNNEGEVELKTLTSKKKGNKSSDHEECVISWQQKIFCQREVELYSNEENCHTVLAKKYNQDVNSKAFNKKGKNMIFTYVDHDDFSYQKEGDQTMTDYEVTPSPLAVKMSNVRCRRMGGRQLREREQGSIPKTLIVEETPTDEFKQRSRLEPPPVQIMYIMADLSPPDRLPTESDEYVLCSIKVDANGVLCVRPDFITTGKPYSIETKVTREGFDYTIENISQEMSRQEQDKEFKMYREMYTRHNDFVQSCVGYEFELPPVDTLRYVVYGEIVSAQDFEKDNLYVQSFIDLPKDWYCDHGQQMSWVTQSCTTIPVNRVETAYFSYPFHFELTYKKSLMAANNEESLPKFPRLMLEVSATDSWMRHFNEGYSYVQLPEKPGLYTQTAMCWRPMGNSIVDNLRRFFIGGTPEIEDLSYAGVPSTLDGSYLSKFGFRTQSSGSVTVRLNIMMQSRSFMENKANKRSLGSLLDTLGITAMQANITSVLEAFKRARMKMMNAREAATQELLREAKPIEKGELLADVPD